MRLIEMTAVAIHQIAVQIHHMRSDLHKDDGILSFVYVPTDLLPGIRYKKEPPITFFEHHGFRDHDQYPQGVADMVGYWAENRILGGVVLYDRGSSGLEVIICDAADKVSGKRADETGSAGTSISTQTGET